MNIDELMREMDALQRRMMETVFSDLQELEKRVERGELEGHWRLEPLEGAGVRGFVARGFFRTPEPLKRPRGLPTPLSPLRRSRREPLYDLTEEEDKVRLYIELPGVEEGEIKLEAGENSLEVDARDFHTVITLPERALDMDKLVKEYRNGVLTVIIPLRRE